MPKADQKAAHRKSDRHRVVELKVEEDGDLHIALHDVTGDKPGVVSVKYLHNRSGVRFAPPFLVGLSNPHGFL